MTNAALAHRYVSLWNEPATARRRQLIEAIWTPDGRHLLQPPEEMRAIAARPGLAMHAVLEAHGYAALEARATSVYEHWVASEGIEFRGRDDVDRLADLAKLHWEAVDRDGAVIAVGLSLLVLAADDRIERDYTFIVA
jgi:hypothetical protein